MEKLFKYILAILVVCTLVGIVVALNNPRPKLTFNDKIRLRQIITRCNADLPREIGTIGYLDSMSFADETITYAVSVKGDDRIMQVYSDNYDEFKDMLKYSFIEMNGQKNLGNTFAHCLEAKGLNICFKVSTENKKSMSWNITGKELSAFVDSCKLSPTTALKKVIDMQIKIVNLKLPVTTSDSSKATTVAINSIVGDVKDESCFLQSIKYEGNNLLFEYKVNDEGAKDIKKLKDRENDLEFMDALVQELAQDKDVLEFIGLLAISHSNMVLVYKNSAKQISLKLPYIILRNHCKIPEDLLSTN
ncbi:MAG: hypothetical protein SPE23_04675 [Sodaliphilus sp.]|jgi:hypothetical protein|nr:hypothetical protein [Sodaliphilus sp.]MDY4759640.1 hypothetical protein [Bacteroidaceae bacterium]